ncbi:hypothetical protein [Actinomadura sp. 9N407]|uniref:hypothetical protein n=1 Tax=Actinomadura sp. 9N407 TaxID=3375154 RepID=UPI0037AAEC7C
MAHAVPLCVLPSGLWRIALVAGVAGLDTSTLPTSEVLYILSLSIITEGLALLTLGLVRPWGETVPGWVPVVGGRRIPTLAVVVPAAVGAVVITAVWAYGILNYFFHFVPPMNDTGQTLPTTGPAALALEITYAPLIAWGPLLAIVTVAYYRRRTRTAAAR